MIEAEGVSLPMDAAVPFGLILNELVTNSLKHGFAGGTVRGSLCGFKPILVDLTLDDLRQPADHVGAKQGQVIRRDISGSATRISASRARVGSRRGTTGAA